MGSVAAAAIAACCGVPLARAEPGPQDIHVDKVIELSPRLSEYQLSTPAIPSSTVVRVLLPVDYASHPDQRYPVLYLLHGCCNPGVGARSWTDVGDAEAITAGLPLIVVMPDGGEGGLYSDWLNAGAEGRPQWETYHLRELLPWVDQTFRTLADRDGRLIDGLSMGGYGAMKYAAEHPDLFLSAASFSGIVDSNVHDGAFHTGLTALDGGTPESAYGDRATEEIRWRGDNPADLAVNLRPVDVTVRTGNGEKGPLDTATSVPYDGVEATAHAMSASFHQRLLAEGVPHLFDDYGPGTHSWAYWQRDLRETLAHQMDLLAKPPVAPRRITYTTTQPSYPIFGWRVKLDRPFLEFSTLSATGPTGFALAGTGSATVRTPPGHRPGATYLVRETLDRAARPTARVRADAAGRLIVPVSLGAANSGQALRPGVTTTVRHATITLTRDATHRP